jgi:hypothetical protein
LTIDIIEKILGDTIVDETDTFMDSSQKIKVQRSESFEWARLRLLDSKIVDGTLSPSEVQAVTAHLRMNHSDSVKLLTDSQLTRLVSNTPVSQLDTATQELGKQLPDDLMYEKGVSSDIYTLILSGKVTVLVGDENFRTDLSPWSVLGRKAFETPSFEPDFSAFVSDGPCRCLRFKHETFVEAVDASAIERHASEMKVSALPPISTDAEHLGVSGDSQSPPSSAEPPNRRENLIARLFKKDSVVAELEAPKPDKAPRVVRFEEGGILDTSSRNQRPMSNDSSGVDRDVVESTPPPSNDNSRNFANFVEPPRPPSNDE